MDSSTKSQRGRRSGQDDDVHISQPTFYRYSQWSGTYHRNFSPSWIHRKTYNNLSMDVDGLSRFGLYYEYVPFWTPQRYLFLGSTPMKMMLLHVSHVGWWPHPKATSHHIISYHIIIMYVFRHICNSVLHVSVVKCSWGTVYGG